MSANARFLDSVELADLRIPYDKFSKLLDNIPALADGENIYQSQNGTLRKRGGIGGDTDLTSQTVSSARIDRLGVYKTNESPAKVYILASIYNGTDWHMRYLRLDDGAPTWTLIPALRGIQNSLRPHEWCVARGKVYIKCYPSSGNDLLGTVIFDGSGASPSVTFWGLLGPSTPARRNGTSASWAASSQTVTVRVGWTYVYTWKTNTGQESARSPVQTDPSQTPSSTGAFNNKRPQIIVQGHSDTTRVPKVVIYRTSDGGGSYRFVEEITNTGAGNITYTDQSVAGTPVLDARLDPTNVAPSVVSNAPPPSVAAPLVTGTDPVAASTPPVYWRGRIWYAIGSVLFFSGDEEIRKGIPLECFPTGFFGNFFAFEADVVHVIPGDEQLTIITENSVEQLTGRFRDEFSTRTVQKVVGGATGQPRASLALGDAGFWLGQDYRVLMRAGGVTTAISTPLGSDLTNTVSADVQWELAPYLANGISWLIVAAHNTADEALSKWWIYDLTTQLWSPPWTGMRSTALAYGRYREDDLVPALIVAAWDGASWMGVGRYQTGSYTDFIPHGATNGYGFSGTLGLLGPPAGNQVNQRTIPALETSLSGVKLEWSGAPTAPTVTIATDDVGAPAIAVTAAEPTLTANDTAGYKTRFYYAERACQRASVKFARTADTQEFILESISLLWEPRQGG